MNTTGFNADLGRQQFMELMVTQLQYQDPLEPVGQQEFLQQLAQFSVVEGVENLNLQFEDFFKLQTLSDGADLVGHEVEYQSPHSGESQRGRVEAARIVDNELVLSINSADVPIANVNALFEGNR